MLCKNIVSHNTHSLMKMQTILSCESLQTNKTNMHTFRFLINIYIYMVLLHYVMSIHAGIMHFIQYHQQSYSGSYLQVSGDEPCNKFSVKFYVRPTQFSNIWIAFFLEKTYYEYFDIFQTFRWDDTETGASWIGLPRSGAGHKGQTRWVWNIHLHVLITTDFTWLTNMLSFCCLIQSQIA